MPDLNFGLSSLANGLLQAAIILIIAFIVVMVLRRLIPRLISARIPKIREESADQLAARSTTLSKVIVQVVSIIIWAVAFVMVLSQLGVDITPLIAAIGVASLALGFAAQNIIRDYLNGFFILMEDWYRVGEVAVIQGTGGVVENLTLRRTVLRDLDGALHVFPNSKVEQASNLTRDWSRINLNIGVAYKENISHVVEVINDVCQQFKDDPKWSDDMLTVPHVERVDNLGDSSVDIKILGDTKPIKQWGLMGELRKRLKDRFDQEGIEIPFPHTTLYFGNPLPENGKVGSAA